VKILISEAKKEKKIIIEEEVIATQSRTKMMEVRG
jgi:hypothetical protein